MTPRRDQRSTRLVRIPPKIVGGSLLVANNLLVHRALRPPADVALNLATAITLPGLALRSGCTRAELGLDRADFGRGVKTGSIAAICCSMGIGSAAVVPSMRRFFLDARVRGMSLKETLYHAGLRIPVATALTEELMFRSGLHALLAREHSLRTTLTWTSLLFGLWHVLPALDTCYRNPTLTIVQNPRRTRPMVALGTLGATAGAGFFFSYLRLRSRSVAAPVVTHAAINVAGLVVARVLVQRADSLSEGDPREGISETSKG